MSKVSLLSIEELIEKISFINNDSVPKWGIMNPSQMVKHCSKSIDLYLGKITVPFWYKYFSVTIGKLFLIYISKLSPLKTPRNLRTMVKSLKISDENLDLDYEKDVLIQKLNNLIDLEGEIDHPIYGKMESEKIKFLIIHHTTHHFNQFDLIN